MGHNKDNTKSKFAWMEEWAKHYKSNFKDIAKIYNNTREELDGLFEFKQDKVGRLLRCHLIIEHFIDRNLEFEINLTQNSEGSFRFLQKVILIENLNPGLKPILIGVREINKVRNRIAHQLNYTIRLSTLPHVKKLVTSYSQTTNSKELIDPIDLIEIFTYLFCHIINEETTEKGRQIKKERIEIYKKYS
ncbi:MAG: hypothetical protein KF846_16595 [Cyclobacteriaceae bacterium]|nr:hypothetical protein [Cyclobacteriaceae bacterium]